MAIAFDAQSSLDFTSTNSFTHTPVAGTIQGVIVLIAQDVASTDLITGVTYGGLACTRLEFAQDTAGEPGASYLYWKPTFAPTGTGAQTVAVTVASGTDAKTAWCISVTKTDGFPLTAARSDSGVVQADTANPSVSFTQNGGFSGFGAAVLFSGQNAPASVTAAGGMTLLTNQRDFGNQSAVAEYGAVSGHNPSVGFTAASEDVAMCAGLWWDARKSLASAGRTTRNTLLRR